jgi:hypothetical protein
LTRVRKCLLPNRVDAKISAADGLAEIDEHGSLIMTGNGDAGVIFKSQHGT